MASSRKAGYKPAPAKVEVEACRAAIRKRRAAAKNQQAVEERDALLDEIFEEIELASRAARHARARGRGRIAPRRLRQFK